MQRHHFFWPPKMSLKSLLNSRVSGCWRWRDSIGRDREEAPTICVGFLAEIDPSTSINNRDWTWLWMESYGKWWMLLNIMLLYNRDILDLNQWKRNNMHGITWKYYGKMMNAGYGCVLIASLNMWYPRYPPVAIRELLRSWWLTMCCSLVDGICYTMSFHFLCI